MFKCYILDFSYFGIFGLSSSGKTPSATEHTKRCSSKSEYDSFENQPMLWHESKVMAKTVSKPALFMKTRDAVFAQNRQRPIFTFWWISTSSKTPRAGRHTRGCVLTWEYVCYKFQNFLRHESRVTVVLVLNLTFRPKPGRPSLPPLICFHFMFGILIFYFLQERNTSFGGTIP